MPRAEAVWSLVGEGHGTIGARNTERSDGFLNSLASEHDMQPFQCVQGVQMVQRNLCLTCGVQRPMQRFGGKGCTT